MTPYHMFLLALQTFLSAHGKAAWAAHIFTDKPAVLAHVTRWAIAHGFIGPA